MIPILAEPPIPRYELRQAFAYNLRCRFCRNERAHTQAQHDKAVTLWAPGDEQ